jgi:hypothetical protein
LGQAKSLPESNCEGAFSGPIVLFDVPKIVHNQDIGRKRPLANSSVPGESWQVTQLHEGSTGYGYWSEENEHEQIAKSMIPKWKGPRRVSYRRDRRKQSNYGDRRAGNAHQIGPGAQGQKQHDAQSDANLARRQYSAADDSRRSETVWLIRSLFIVEYVVGQIGRDLKH